MTVTEALLAFILAAGLLTLSPGLDSALVLRTAAAEGGRRAFAAALGICLGCVAWGIIAAVGLGALLAVSELAYAILRWCGAAYLLYLGGKMIWNARAGFDPAAGAGESAGSGWRWFTRGLVTNLLNPKIGVFYVTFLPQFVPAGVEVVSFTVLLAAIHAAEGILWFAALILATRPLAAVLRRPAVVRWLDRATGAVLIGFGLKLALESRR